MKRGRRRLRQNTALLKDSVDSGSNSDVVVVTSSNQKMVDNTFGLAWSCPLCTYLNADTTRKRCEMCDSARPELPKRVRNFPQWLPQPMKYVKHESNMKGVPLKPWLDPQDEIDNSENEDIASVNSSALCIFKTNQFNKSNSNASKTAAAKSRKGLWIDFYAPETAGDLCVSKKKVQEMYQWFEQNALARSGVIQKRLLFVCGPPGSGKSTAVRCIARKLNVLIKEWEDNSAAGKLKFERMPHVPVEDNFSEFMYRSSAYAALPISTSRPPYFADSDRRLACSQRESDYIRVSSVSSRQIVLVESFSLAWSNDSLLYEEKLKRIYQRVIASAGGSQYPIVCIYSASRGRKVDLDYLSKKFSHEVMNSPLTSVIYINGVTSAQLKKQLVCVAEQENFKCKPSVIHNIIDRCNGDMRYALNMLQFLQNLNLKTCQIEPANASMQRAQGANALKVSMNSSELQCHTRDFFLSDFHVVGKLLHGKVARDKFAQLSSSKRDASNFDYDQIFDRCAMPLNRVLELVHENSIAYFLEVEDLAEALELMSLCEVIIAKSYNGANCLKVSKRSRDVAQAVLMHTVAVANNNPAPKAFRPILRPRTYSATQRIVTRRKDMLHATRGEQSGLQFAFTGDVFAFEVEPFLSIMDRVSNSSTIPNAGGGTNGTESLLKENLDEIENSADEW